LVSIFSGASDLQGVKFSIFYPIDFAGNRYISAAATAQPVIIIVIIIIIILWMTSGKQTSCGDTLYRCRLILDGADVLQHLVGKLTCKTETEDRAVEENENDFERSTVSRTVVIFCHLSACCQLQSCHLR